MINQQEENTLKSVVGKLAKQVEEFGEKLDGVVSAQGKVDISLQELATARKTGTPVQFMEATTVEKTIENKLNSQLVGSKVSIDLRNTTFGMEYKEIIDGIFKKTGPLIFAVNRLVETIKPRKSLFNLNIYDGKKAMWFGISLAGLCMIVLIVVIIWAHMKVNAIQDQDYFWANRAYQAARRSDIEHPGDTYDKIMTHFIEDPKKSKEIVNALEIEAKRYREIKQYLLSIIGEKITRDIRVLAWDINHGECWFKYRYYDEDTERSIHVWPDGKVEETTDKIVTDLGSAQKYSKRKIWTVIREAPATEAE